MTLILGIANLPGNTANQERRLAWKKVARATEKARKTYDAYAKCAGDLNDICDAIEKTLKDIEKRTSGKPDYRIALMEAIRQHNLGELRRHNALLGDADDARVIAWKELHQVLKKTRA